MPSLLSGIDRAAFVVAFARRLRQHGLPVGVTGVEDFARALAATPPDSLTHLYWTARITLARRHEEIETFDAVFDAVFQDARLALDPHARRGSIPRLRRGDSERVTAAGRTPEQNGGNGVPWVTLPQAAAERSEPRYSAPELGPSRLASISETPFEQLDPESMAQLGAWLASVREHWPTRRTRRLTIDPTGRHIAIRPTIARSRRTGWEPITLVRARSAIRPRRVVMLCDVSQSMQAQTTAYLHLMRAMVLTANAEVFAFATRTTRLTAVLAHTSPEAAIQRTTAKVTDRFGGTRIATSVRTLLTSHHGGSVRGAVVIIGSDGWDSDPPEELAATLARLRRRAHRLIWINPRVAAPGFEPRVAAMATALPFCDQLLPGHTFGSLRDAISVVARDAGQLHRVT